VSAADCGCCTPGAAPTPVEVENRPALSAVVYRIGTYASFREAMLEALADAPELAGLTTRESDDFAVMLLQMWSAVGDVLTFYQERYANEAFLRTATFRDSITRLGALIDYRLRPGVAARTALAFTLDGGARLTIPARQRVQSVPGPDEQPQTFETLEPLAADVRLNRLRVYPAPVAVNPLATATTASLLDRLTGPVQAARLSADDGVVIFNNSGTAAVEEKTIAALRREDDRASVVWSTPVQGPAWTAASQVWKRGRTHRPFGHNAPAQYMVAKESPPGRITWTLTNAPSFALPAGTTLKLDSRRALPLGQRLLVADGGAGGRQTLVQVTAAVDVQDSFGAITDTITQLTVAPAIPAIANRQNVTIYELQDEALAFAAAGYPGVVTGDTVHLPGVARATDDGPAIEVERVADRNGFSGSIVLPLDLLAKGRTVLLGDGKQIVRARVKAAPGLEPPGAAPGAFCHLAVALDPDSPLALDRSTAVLLGNVAAASHGETVAGEVVGSGDESARFQRLALKKAPLTYLPAPTEEGVASTLELSVNGVRWSETQQLFGQPPEARVFEARPADDLKTVLQFGDGVTGRALPTGRNNVVATYRVGTGLAGRVGAGALTTLLGKPPGVTSVVNPQAAEGGADPETRDTARERAPRTVRTFGRIVSLRDFEDQVTVSGEVAKAQANWIWDGLDRAVFLTVAGQEGAVFSAAALAELGTNLRRVRDPNHRLLIGNYRRVYVQIVAGVAIDPARDRDVVLAAARAAVIDLLSFARVALGQALHLSEIYATLQAVPGVVFADVDRFLFKRPPGFTDAQFASYVRGRGGLVTAGVPAVVQDNLRVFVARPNPALPGQPFPAELPALETPADDLTLTVRLP
jgi:hypothetical protein